MRRPSGLVGGCGRSWRWTGRRWGRSGSRRSSPRTRGTTGTCPRPPAHHRRGRGDTAALAAALPAVPAAAVRPVRHRTCRSRESHRRPAGGGRDAAWHGHLLLEWIRQAEHNARKHLKGFAGFLRQDLDAVTAGLILPWSSGVTEGHINRVKTLKRAMYG
ncbi:transposase [Streptomyces sp. NPDC050504]|uniref:transposase n=1 Tax=Streptomyces sp. NPDC050504 TaxID=3365618 RepID=UPI0037B25501